MRGTIVAPCAKRLKSIIFQTVPNISNDGCRPYFEITNNIDDTQIQYSSLRVDSIGQIQPVPAYKCATHEVMQFEFEEEQEPVLSGDVHVMFK